MNRITVLLLLAAAVLTPACRSYKTLDLEMYWPATVSFPPAATVMIVNNAAKQPDHIGHHFTISGSSAEVDSIVSVSADSAAHILCVSLGEAIAEAPVFSDVRICRDTLRRDPFFYEAKPLTPVDVRALCSEYGVDALISLDKFTFNSARSYTNLSHQLYVHISGELRALWPDQKETYVFPFSDSLLLYSNSLMFYSDALTDEVEWGTISNVNMAINKLSAYIGHKMYVHFIPYWLSGQRLYYGSPISEWKRGVAAIAAKRWDDAAAIWQQLLTRTKKQKQQAKLYANLALCSEMSDDFVKALEYAEKSYNLFKKCAGEDNEHTTLLKNYYKTLELRKQADTILAGQLREK